MIKKVTVAGLCLMVLVFQAWAQYPVRIISLAPSVTKSLYWLDAGDLLAGCTSFCILQHPGDAEVVATAVQVNLEKAVILNPDLVIATPLTNPETIRTFEKLGIEVLSFPYPRSFDEICENMMVLGRKIGKENVAGRLIADTRERLGIVKSKVPRRDQKPTVFFQIGADPLFTAVPNTFMQDFIDFAGCLNIAADLKVGSITRETVLIRNPDVIMVLMMGTVSREEKEKWEVYKNLKAVKNHRVFMIDDEKTCSPTPELFVEALEEMIGLIYE
ncbi:MAG: helical backbone metal receptor [Mangrovibacterium sp.]|nr:helical backbone metal receptor [Mangrovibacterium sp.]